MNPENLSPEEIETLKNVLAKSEASTKKTKVSKPSSTKQPRRRSREKGMNRFAILGIAFLGVCALAAAYVFAIEPKIIEWQLTKQLEAEARQSAIVVSNSDFVPYVPDEEDILPGANPSQLALGSDGIATPPAYFEFKSENADEKSYVVDLYIDFYSQLARDFIAFNQDTIRPLIENGRIILRVHPAVQKNGFSIYAPEALAEVSTTHPDKAWHFFTKLMKESNTILSSNSPEDKQASDQEVMDFIASISLASGIPAGACTSSPCNTVDADSIKFLTFFSWLYAAADDPKLSVGYYPPVIYIDDKLIDQDTYKLANPDDVRAMFNTYAPRR